MPARPNGLNAMALSTRPLLSANSAGHNGPPVTTIAFQTLPLKVSRMRKARSKAPVSTSRHLMLKGLGHRGSRMEISGARRTSRITAQNPFPRRLVVGGDTQPTLMTQRCPALRNEERRRRRRRIGGRGQRMRILFPRNRPNRRDQRRRRKAIDLPSAATVFIQGILRQNSPKLLKAGYMAMARKSLTHHDPLGQTRTFLAISFEEFFWVIICIAYCSSQLSVCSMKQVPVPLVGYYSTFDHRVTSIKF